MDLTFSSRVKHAFNAFLNKDPTKDLTNNYNNYSGGGSYYRPDRTRLSRGNERSIITSIINRIALDVASIDIKHCRVDEEDRFKEIIRSKLNTCLTLESNIDQTSRAFIQDAIMSMLDEGCVALVPVDTTINPDKSDSYDILSMRTGKIIEWYPSEIKVNVYNERTGRREDIRINKRNVAIIENPQYAIMATFLLLIRMSSLLPVRSL